MRLKPYAGKFGAAVWVFVIVAISFLGTASSRMRRLREQR